MGNDDKVATFESAIPITEAFSQKELYDICDEGLERYKKNVPPGFKDAKDKDGIRQYSDLIIWKEIIRYAKQNKKSIIFVTDDVKPDWWEGNSFHSKLIEEFKKETGQEISAFVSTDFYEAVANSFGVQKSDLVEIALNMTDEDYALNVQDQVFYKIYDSLMLSGDSYLSKENNIGTEGIGDLEELDHEFVSVERAERDGTGVKYIFVFYVEVEGYSTDYWGRDDDTKEAITSPEMYHKFAGEIKVGVTREADIFIDYEEDDCFETCEIIEGELEEKEFRTWAEDEPDYEKDLGHGFCGMCGKALTVNTDAGNGYCFKCSEEYDK